MYFDTQQKQIDAVEEASKNQLERLDHQIDLMQETLDYQKEYGLLWDQVSGILEGSTEEILAFIKGNTSEYWSKSSVELGQILRQNTFELDQYKKYRGDVVNGLGAIATGLNIPITTTTTTDTSTTTTSSNTGTGSGTGSKGGTGGSTRTGKYQTPKEYYTFNGQKFDPKDINTSILYYQTDDGHWGIVSGYGVGNNSSHYEQAWAKSDMMRAIYEKYGIHVTEISSNQRDLSLYRAAAEAGLDFNDMLWDDDPNTSNIYIDPNGNVINRGDEVLMGVTPEWWDAYQSSIIKHGGTGNIPFEKSPDLDWGRIAPDGKEYTGRDLLKPIYNALDEKTRDALTLKQSSDLRVALINSLAEGIIDESQIGEAAQELAQIYLSGKSVHVVNPNGVKVDQYQTYTKEQQSGLLWNLIQAENNRQYLPYMSKRTNNGKKYTYLVGPQYEMDTLPIYNSPMGDWADEYKGKDSVDIDPIKHATRMIIPSIITEVLNGSKDYDAKVRFFTNFAC